MFPTSQRQLAICGLILLGALGGCRDDDPTEPLGGRELWEARDMGPALTGSALLAVDFDGAHGAILGFGSLNTELGNKRAGGGNYILRYELGYWVAATPADLTPGVTFADLAVDDVGDLVVVGYVNGVGDRSRIYDARDGTTQSLQRSGLGSLAVDGEDEFFVAGGFATGGVLWTSPEPGAWVADFLPLSGTNDAGFRDVFVRGDMAVACGFDDGADTLQVVLQRTSTTNWTKIPLGANTFGLTLHSVALAENGALYVGGVLGAGGPTVRAYLAVRSVGGDWSEVVLPDQGLIGAVNDILPAGDGSVYAACSGEVSSDLATIVRAHGGGVDREIVPFPGDIFQMAEGPDGRIHAVGTRHAGSNGATSALLLTRPAPR